MPPQCHLEDDNPATTRRKRALLYTQGWHSTFSPKQFGRGLASPVGSWARASAAMNCAVSLFQRPPRRQEPRDVRDHPLLRARDRCLHHRRVDGQLGSVSSLRPSSVLKVARSMSRTNMFEGDPSGCLSTDLRCGALERERPLPQHLTLGTLRDGGQTRRVGSHIGRCGETGGEEGAVCGRGGAGKAWGRFSLLLTSATQQKPKVQAGTSTSPSGNHSDPATPRRTGT